MNANVEEVISVAQCADIFLRVSKRPEFDVIYSSKEVLEQSGIQKIERLSEVIRWFVLRPQMKLNVSVPRSIFLTRLLPAVSWKRSRP